MIRAVMWKEFREQGLIGLALLTLGGGVLAAAAALADPPLDTAQPTDVLRFLGAGRLAALMLAVTAGTVAGGALFAAEREAGTITFLESLPVCRWHVWRAKVVAGAVLAAGQVGGVIGFACLLGVVGGSHWAAAAGIAAYALIAFAWGTFGSTVSRTTLGSVGIAVPFAALASIVFAVPVVLVFGGAGGLPHVQGGVVFFALMLVTPLVASAVVYTQPDRDRRGTDLRPRAAVRVAVPARPVAEVEPVEPVPTGGRPRVGLLAVAWLAGRQLAVPAVVLAVFAGGFGLALLAPPVVPFLFWPPLALAAGVLAAVVGFADEQGRGVGRFWAEQRLPVGRMWGVKVAAHVALAVGLLAAVALPGAVRAGLLPAGSPGRTQTFLGTAFRSRLFDHEHLGADGWVYVLAPPLYGFAAGHVAALLFRKPVVAAGVAALAGGTLAAGWLPSALAGGLGWGWVVAPPAVLLVTGWLAVRAWAAGRLPSRGPIRVLAAGLAVAVGVEAAGLGWRVLEVPDRPDAEADLRFIDALPQVEQNDGGRLFAAAAARFARVYGAAAAAGPPLAVSEGLAAGWPDAGSPLDRWLDALWDRDVPGEPPWHAVAADAAARPGGVYEDPRLIPVGRVAAGSEAVDAARRMGNALLARGLQRQIRGDPGEFPRLLNIALALADALRRGSVVAPLEAGNALERAAQVATERWADRLRDRPDLLRLVLARWRAADAGPPFDPRPYLLAERYVLRGTLAAPSQWLPDALTPPGGDKDDVASEVDAVAFAWTVPWERERLRRLVGQGFEQGAKGGGSLGLVRGRPGYVFFQPRQGIGAARPEIARRLEVGRRLTVAKLALAVYRAETGRPAASLDALVPSILPAVPADPYGDGPLHYRVSAGEPLEVVGGRPRRGGQPPRTWDVPAGKGVVWSGGPPGSPADGRRILLPTDPYRLQLLEDDPVAVVPGP